METQEKNFEETIQKYLITKGGYHISDGLGYDRLKGYNPKVLIDFIASTQNKKWMKLMSLHGKYTKDYFLKKVEEQIKEHGLLSTLRDKIKLDGMEFRLVFFKPETSMNSELEELYDCNILECVRQLHYSIDNGYMKMKLCNRTIAPNKKYMDNIKKIIKTVFNIKNI